MCFVFLARFVGAFLNSAIHIAGILEYNLALILEHRKTPRMTTGPCSDSIPSSAGEHWLHHGLAALCPRDRLHFLE